MDRLAEIKQLYYHATKQTIAESFDRAIDLVKAMPSEDESVADDFLRRTTSGGACINTAGAHGALPSLPFGGIGQSGSGRNHGVEGFREFSNLRGVFVRGEGDLIDAFSAPYGPAADAIIDAAFAG